MGREGGGTTPRTGRAPGTGYDVESHLGKNSRILAKQPDRPRTAWTAMAPTAFASPRGPHRRHHGQHGEGRQLSRGPDRMSGGAAHGGRHRRPPLVVEPIGRECAAKPEQVSKAQSDRRCGSRSVGRRTRHGVGGVVGGLAGAGHQLSVEERSLDAGLASYRAGRFGNCPDKHANGPGRPARAVRRRDECRRPGSGAARW